MQLRCPRAETARAGIRLIRRIACAAGVIAVLAPLTTLAEDQPDNPVLIGAGVRTIPAYDGASANVWQLIPILRYYGRPWFARTTQGILEGGARIEPAKGFALGIQAAYEGGRPTRDSAFLRDHSVENIPVSASVGVHAELDHNIGPMPVTYLLRLRPDVDRSQGTQADLRITGGVYGGERFQAGIYVQATWADRSSNQSYYGITLQQSVTTGLPAYEPGGGLQKTYAGVLWSFDLAREWILVGGVDSLLMRGTAARSPLVQDRSNVYVSVALAYRF